MTLRERSQEGEEPYFDGFFFSDASGKSLALFQFGWSPCLWITDHLASSLRIDPKSCWFCPKKASASPSSCVLSHGRISEFPGTPPLLPERRYCPSWWTTPRAISTLVVLGVAFSLFESPLCEKFSVNPHTRKFWPNPAGEKFWSYPRRGTFFGRTQEGKSFGKTSTGEKSGSICMNTFPYTCTACRQEVSHGFWLWDRRSRFWVDSRHLVTLPVEDGRDLRGHWVDSLGDPIIILVSPSFRFCW